MGPTLATAGALVISEGIKFLYGQASELLKRMRDRKEQDRKAEAPAVEPVQVTLPAQAFEGQLQNPEIHYQQLEELQDRLYEQRKVLADYADGLATVDPADRDIMSTVDSLRQMLEAVYGQRITFKGEQREPSGPVVEGEIDVERILGEAMAVEARLVQRGLVKGTVKAKEIAAGAKVIATKIDTIG